MRLSKYSNTSVDFFMGMPAREFGEWFMTAVGEVQRENKELERIKAQAGKKAK